jgi:branched-chain amino acid transport system permease protein
LSAATLAQSFLNGFAESGIYILVALGLTLVLSIIGIVQMAHGEIYMIGAYGLFYLSSNLGINYYLSFIIAVVFVGGVGVLLEKVFFRPIRGQPERALIISMGLILVLQNIVLTVAGGNPKSYYSPYSGVLKIAEITVLWDRIVIVGVSIALLLALFFFVRLNKTGQAMLAISQDREGAALQGINIDRLSALAMFLGCAMAAIAGAMIGALLSITPTMGSFALMKGIAVIVLGGLGSIPGAVVGGLLIGMIDGVLPVVTTTYISNLICFAAIIVIMIFRPQGLWGHE